MMIAILLGPLLAALLGMVAAVPVEQDQIRTNQVEWTSANADERFFSASLERLREEARHHGRTLSLKIEPRKS